MPAPAENQKAAPPDASASDAEGISRAAKSLAESGLALLDALDELDRAELQLVEVAVRAEEQRKIDQLKKGLNQI